MSNTRLEKNPLPPEVVETALKNWAQAGKQSKFSVIGNSMYPFLLPGDILHISHNFGQAHPGNLLAFRQGRTLIVHRLLQIRKANNVFTYLTKGDNCAQSDPLVQDNQVVGIVYAIQRCGVKVDLKALTWQIASRTIAASACFGLTIDRWGRRLKQQFAGPNPNPLTTSIRHAVLALLSIPGRVLSWMLWSRS